MSFLKARRFSLDLTLKNSLSDCNTCLWDRQTRFAHIAVRRQMHTVTSCQTTNTCIHKNIFKSRNGKYDFINNQQFTKLQKQHFHLSRTRKVDGLTTAIIFSGFTVFGG